MVLKIYKKSDQILRKPCDEVTDFGHDFQQFVDDLVETMRKYNGIGLAAPQVGVSKKIFVCEFEGDKELGLSEFPLTVVCNPQIIHKSKKATKMVEGCLSFPGMEILIDRPEEIVIKGQDRHGKPIEIKADSLYARVLQHENDHLHSTLLIDHIQEIKTVFIGTGTLGVKTLELLEQDLQYKVSLVVTGDVKARGRKKHQVENPILKTAKKYDIPVLITDNIKEESVIKKISIEKPDLGIMADFGQIVPQAVLDIPKYGIVNIHPSLLPEHRGPSPVQQSILDGDKESGVTLILTSKKMDAGDIISQVKCDLSQAETSSTLKNYLSEIGAALVLNTIPYYIAGDLKPIPQKEEQATYTRLFDKEDGKVDENTDKLTVERKIRAFDVWPKVFIIKNNRRIQLISAHFEEDGELVIDKVKPEGKKEMSYEDFLRGYKTKLTFK